MKKLLFVVVCVIVFLVLWNSGRLDFLKPKKMTFDTIVSGFERNGFTVTDRRPASLLPRGAVKGEDMTVGGTSVSVYRFADVGRLSVEYENYKPGAGDAIALRMGITTQLGVQSRPVSGLPTYPAKKRLYLLVVQTRDKRAADQITKSFLQR